MAPDPHSSDLTPSHPRAIEVRHEQRGPARDRMARGRRRRRAVLRSIWRHAAPSLLGRPL